MNNKSDFINALVMLANEQGSIATILDIRNKALIKIQNNLGLEMVSTSIQGKSFNSQISMSSIDIFSCATAAIDQYNRGYASATLIDFSNLRNT